MHRNSGTKASRQDISCDLSISDNVWNIPHAQTHEASSTIWRHSYLKFSSDTLDEYNGYMAD
jgi:hypothetical protein